MLTRVIGLTFQAHSGRSAGSGDVVDCFALDLATPRPGRRPNLSTVALTRLGQPWLRDAARQWAEVARPDSQTLTRTVAACAVASRALAARPGGGQDLRQLRYADMTAVFDAFAASTRADGQPYSARFRRGLWARFLAVVDFGRASELLADLPAGFARSRSHTMPSVEVNEDEIGKTIPNR
jgi:hypothetical protein